MILADSKVELVPCACLEDHVTLRWRKCGLFMALLTTSGIAALFFPYIIIVVRNTMSPFLPLISNAGGQPPSNGVFGLFLVIGSFFGFITYFLVFETVNHRNTKDNKIIQKGNKIGIILAIISALGFIIVACYPVGFTDLPNMFEWMTTVLYEHGIGASFVLVGIATYQFILSGIWWFLPDATTKDKYIKIAFIAVYFLFFLITVYPLPVYITEQFGSNPLDYARYKKISYNHPVVYSTNLLICSVCEYALCILSLMYFATLYKDLQHVSMRVVLLPKSCWSEEVESVGPHLQVLP